jgi:biopolymer transport protein ExbB
MDSIAQVWRIWESGGVVMIPLFGLAVVLYTEGFQLVLYLRHVGLAPENAMHWWDWVRSPEHAEGEVAEIIRYTQSDVSSAKQICTRFDEVRAALLALLERRTRFLGMLVAAAPLLGLLGTVFGMLQMFFGISTSGGGETAAVVAAGISEALITTQMGLMEALPGLFLVMLLQRRRHHLEAQLARLESLTLRRFRFD